MKNTLDCIIWQIAQLKILKKIILNYTIQKHISRKIIMDMTWNIILDFTI